MNWCWVRKVYQRVTEPHVKFYVRFITLRYNVSFVRIWSWNAWRSVVRKNSALQTVHYTELAHKNCATSFPSIRRRLRIFHWWACLKLVDDILNTCSDRCFTVLCVHFELNDNVGFCSVMFMSTVTVLGVFSAWITIKYHALIKNLKCVFCCKFPLLQYCQIFLRSVNNTQSNRKNKKGGLFWNTVYRNKFQ